MKRYTSIFCVILLVSMLTGCRMNTAQPATTQPTTTAPTTQPATAAPTTTQPTQTTGVQGTSGTGGAALLTAIWDLYADEERFSVYGGTVEHAVSDAPGDLDLHNTEELTAKYLIPQESLSTVEDGASLVHMMNSNIFTAAAIRLTQPEQRAAFAESWRSAIQQNRWICGQPDRLLILAAEDGHLVMAFGSTDAIDVFRAKAAQADPKAETLYDEAIVG